MALFMAAHRRVFWSAQSFARSALTGIGGLGKDRRSGGEGQHEAEEEFHGAPHGCDRSSFSVACAVPLPPPGSPHGVATAETRPGPGDYCTLNGAAYVALSQVVDEDRFAVRVDGHDVRRSGRGSSCGSRQACGGGSPRRTAIRPRSGSGASPDQRSRWSGATTSIASPRPGLTQRPEQSRARQSIGTTSRPRRGRVGFDAALPLGASDHVPFIVDCNPEPPNRLER
jgi:hypothetical protein